MPNPKDDGKTYYKAPKTTKGDGMERRAERHICGTNGDSYQFQHEIKSLTRLLREVAREAARREREACAKIADQAEDAGGVDASWIADAIRNRRSA